MGVSSLTDACAAPITAAQVSLFADRIVQAHFEADPQREDVERAALLNSLPCLAERLTPAQVANIDFALALWSADGVDLPPAQRAERTSRALQAARRLDPGLGLQAGVGSDDDELHVLFAAAATNPSAGVEAPVHAKGRHQLAVDGTPGSRIRLDVPTLVQQYDTHGVYDGAAWMDAGAPYPSWLVPGRPAPHPSWLVLGGSGLSAVVGGALLVVSSQEAAALRDDAFDEGVGSAEGAKRVSQMERVRTAGAAALVGAGALGATAVGLRILW